MTMARSLLFNTSIEVTFPDEEEEPVTRRMRNTSEEAVSEFLSEAQARLEWEDVIGWERAEMRELAACEGK